MNWLPIVFIVIILFAGWRWINDEKANAKREGLQEAVTQIAEDQKQFESDAVAGMKKAVAERDARIKELEANQQKRVANETAKRKTSPAYASWANTPVPDDVVSELRRSAEAANGVPHATGDGKSGTAVQATSPVAPGKDGQRRLGPVRPAG